MSSVINDKDLKTIRRLGNAIDSGTIPIREIRKFLAELQQKVESSAEPPGKIKANPIDSRKDKYKTKLKVA